MPSNHYTARFTYQKKLWDRRQVQNAGYNIQKIRSREKRQTEAVWLASTVQRYCFCKCISIIITGSEYWHQSTCLVGPPSHIDITSRSGNFGILVYCVSFIRSTY